MKKLEIELLIKAFQKQCVGRARFFLLNASDAQKLTKFIELCNQALELLWTQVSEGVTEVIDLDLEIINTTMLLTKHSTEAANQLQAMNLFKALQIDILFLFKSFLAVGSVDDVKIKEILNLII